MNNKVNINRILDEDQLTPAQQRIVRNQFNYKIKDDDGGGATLYYNPKGTEIKECFTLHRDLIKTKHVAYKHLMFDLLVHHSSGLPETYFKDQVRDAIRKDIVAHSTGKTITIDSQHLFGLLSKMNVL